MRVEDVMNKALVVSENISLKEAARLMSEHNLGCLTIMKGEQVTGIITERDIIKNISKLGGKVSKIMSKNVISVDKNESLDNAARIMAKNKIKKLPVIHKGQLVGIVTSTDVIAHSDDLNENYLLD
ncbi:MAG: CBS domain-containing protein [archaeon]